ncbi:hypothetical protein Taro_011064 [Colocasia esculenta]|uniref:Uncharacterized protein n=1 Tax=Colocasia esculenta TaxID=4460 RepID=A0A843U4V8_COLES|nr:hypothetical protein [Colocasia esculenta]
MSFSRGCSVSLMSSFASTLLEFLLLWLVRDWWRRDLWGSLAGSGRSGRYSGIRAQGSNEICNELITMAVPKKGSECELQESVTTVAGCTCFEHCCWFARAAIGFVIGLRVRVGVSRRLREPTCCVAFTGAGLWSAEPLCVWPCVPVRHWALCSTQSASLLELSRCFVCRVAPLLLLSDLSSWEAPGSCGVASSGGNRKVLA